MRRVIGANPQSSLGTLYAMSGPGTEIAFGAIYVRACLTVPSTDKCCGAIYLRECHVMSGIGVAHAPPNPLRYVWC